MTPKRKLVYDKSPWFRLYTQDVENNGSIEKHPVVERPNAVTVIPISKSNKTILVKVFRTATQKYSWELPSGFIDGEETSEQAAIRELNEETRLEVDSLKHIGKYYPVPALITQTVDVYVAEIEDNKFGTLGEITDKDVREIKIVDLNETTNMVTKGEITDGFALNGLLYLKLYLQ